MFHRRGLLTAAALGAVLSMGAGAACAESLADAIELAYRTNPTLQEQRAQQRVIDEEYVQAQAGLRPTLAINATSEQLGGFSGGIHLQNNIQETQAEIIASQPIYTGGRVARAISAAQADVYAGREQLRVTTQTILTNVIQAYEDVRLTMESVSINEANREVLQKQLDQTNAQFEVGEVTRTDVALAQARLAAAESALAQARAQLEISRSTYTNVIGQRPGTLDPEPDLAGVPDNFDGAMDVAVNANPALRQAQFQEQAAHHRVAQARSAYMPSVTANATYGATFQPTFGLSLEQRTGTTIGGQVQVPLFTGGLTGSQVRVALEKDNAARVAVDAAERDVLRDVSAAWAEVLSTRVSMASNEQQVKANEIAAEGSRQEYQVGLRTTLDVLNAEQELRDAQLALVTSRHDNYLAMTHLLQAMGTLDARSLSPGVKLYDPKRNFKHVRDQGTVLYDKALQQVDKLGPGPGHSDRTQLAPIDTELKTKTPREPPPR
jgi:outer membrane protein